MKCEECNKGIEGTYYEVDGDKTVCAKCYEVREYTLKVFKATII